MERAHSREQAASVNAPKLIYNAFFYNGIWPDDGVEGVVKNPTSIRVPKGCSSFDLTAHYVATIDGIELRSDKMRIGTYVLRDQIARKFTVRQLERLLEKLELSAKRKESEHRKLMEAAQRIPIRGESESAVSALLRKWKKEEQEDRDKKFNDPVQRTVHKWKLNLRLFDTRVFNARTNNEVTVIAKNGRRFDMKMDGHTSIISGENGVYCVDVGNPHDLFVQ
ncbi:MAG: hypothetical protein M1504_00050 [Candidatus Marsarchaeota archaeon]|nr:hypothetical protein [Candidatus Marsarchaeota archaeon]